MIFVTGGTGNIGRGLLADLRAAGAPARVLVRNDAKAALVAEEGFEPVLGDLERPAELAGALDGADSVFLLSSQHPRQAELQNGVVEAAKRAGVRLLVKVSSADPVIGLNSPSWVGRAHAETERAIEASGMEYALLRPNYFMQNMLALAEPIRNGVLPVAFGDARVALIDTRDIGAVAAKILTSEAPYDSRVYPLTGPDAPTFAEVATRLSATLGRDIRYVDTPLETVLETMRGRGAPDWLVEHIRQIITVFRTGVGGDTTTCVEEILGRPPRPLEDFAHDNAETLGTARVHSGSLRPPVTATPSD